MPPERFTAVVLAAQRAGEVNALAQSFGMTHKCLIPVAGQPLIRHVVAALAGVPGLQSVRISVEPELFELVREALAGMSVSTAFVPAADNLADSVYACVQGISEPAVITTADNVLLLPSSVTSVLKALVDADGAIALTTKSAVLAAHRDGQRRFYRFADESYSNCNLYAVAGRKSLSLVEAFRSGGRFKKNPRRLVMTLGLFNLLRLLLGRLTLRGAAERIGHRFGLRLIPVTLADGSQAIDVDNPRSHAIAEQLLLAREAEHLRAA